MRSVTLLTLHAYTQPAGSALQQFRHSSLSRSLPPADRRTASDDIYKETSPNICTYELRGRCRHGARCRGYHSPYDLTYQWQWRPTGGDRPGASWRDFGAESIVRLEEQFADVAVSICRLAAVPDFSTSDDDADDERIAVDFDSMTYSDQGVGGNQVSVTGTNIGSL